MRKTLVVSYGSIGQRHARLLNELEFEVAVVSRRSIDVEPHYSNLTQALISKVPLGAAKRLASKVIPSMTF